MAKEIAEEYASSLADLTVNSKPLINMLTILAEENVEHAGVIVETVEKHLEKVNPEVKLPVLYLVDSIIKNVGGAYVQKFSDRIVHIFTRTFKQVDEKIRSQMFKLRETWHDVFPATKLYQLDVKVNLIDPAWPIQAQPVTQPAIHPAASTVPAPLTEDEERMRAALATKEQELLMLQRKKIEMELEHTRRQLEIAEKQAKKLPLSVGVPAIPVVPPIAMVNPQLSLGDASALSLPAKARLGPPVSKPVGTSRIAPVTGALAGARRDPRLLRRVPPAVAPPPPPAAPIAPHVFDIKPLKRKNVITFDVQQDTARVPPRDPRPRDPRVNNDKRGQRKRDDRDAQIDERHRKRLKERLFIEDKPQPPTDKQERFDYMSKYQIPDPKKINKLPPIPKINRDESKDSNINSNNTPSPKKKKETINKKPSKKEIQEKDTISTSSLSSVSSFSSPEKKSSSKRKDKKKEIKERELKEKKIPEELKEESVAFKELKNYHKEHYMRRNREASESPEPVKIETPMELDGPSVPEASKDVDLRVLPAVVKPAAVHKRPSTETVEGNTKKTKLDKFDILFGNEDVDLRQLPELPHEEAATTIPAVAATNIPATSIAATTGIPASVGIAATTGIPASVGIAASTGIPASVGMAATTGIPASVGIAASTGAALSSTGAAKAGPAAAILPATAGIVTTTIPAATTGPPATSGPATSGPAATTTIPEAVPAPELPDRNNVDEKEKENKIVPTAPPSPKKDWHEVKEKVREEDASVKKPSKLDLVRAKLAEATKGKDRLGRPLLFSKSPSVERERRRTISSEDTDLRLENPPEFDAEDHKKTISIIMEQAKQQFTDGQLDKSQYNTLMYQVLQLNEKLKLKEAKQRESLELSKRKLKATVREKSPKSSPNSHNTFGDIDERVTPLYMDTPRDHQGLVQDSDMRMHMMDQLDGHRPSLLPAPRPAGRSMSYPAYPQWGAPAPRPDEYVPRRFRGPSQYYRPRFEPRPRGPVFEPRLPLPPPPKVGMLQGENPLPVYERAHSPPPLGVPLGIPPTDYRVLEYIDQDPVKTIQIDGVPREIRFYGETAIIMLDWDDPREIKFLPGCRRVTFDNKDSIVISFNDPYKQVEIEDHIFDIRFGAPTRELYINRRWYECFFGGQPLSVLIDGKHHLVHLEGPLPQVDIGKVKRTDLVAGKINLIVNATQMSPIYLDAKVQKFMMNGQFYTIRFVDSLRTVLINEEPFKVEFGDLPKPITVGGEKFFIRFSALPRGIKPGMIQIAEMEGVGVPSLPQPVIPFESIHMESPMEVEPPRPPKTPSPDREHQGGLELLASVMPSSVEAPASASAYSVAEPLFHRPETIPGLESAEATSLLGNINVTDLFAKLVATGIVSMPSDKQDKENKPEPESKEDKENKQDKKTDKVIEKEEKKEEPKEIEKPKPQEIKAKIRLVDLLRPETLRVAQPGVVARLYGGMQCSGCGVRFPPEHTVQYSQHLDWHFRQNRRERESARRAHSRQWHYDIGDWVQYGEIADWDEREKSWFETVSAEGAEEIVEPEVEPPSVAAGAPAEAYCALCGDRFHQFFNEDQEEWHLKNSVRHEDKNYHPLCFDDYKASLTKDLTSDDVVAIEPAPMEPIEIKDDTMDDTTQSDAESVVEVLDEQRDAPVEIIEEAEEGDEDDVVFKAEPVVQVTVDDDADTDDETALERKERDQAVDFSKVKIKQEPCDPDDEPIITAEEESIQPIPEPIHNTTVLSSIDGNVQLESTPATVPMGGIRINISKTIPSFLSSVPTVPDRDRTTNDREMTFSDISADDEPCPPGEEPELEYTMKDSLKGVALSRLPPVKKGSELSGLCSIM